MLALTVVKLVAMGSFFIFGLLFAFVCLEALVEDVRWKCGCVCRRGIMSPAMMVGRWITRFHTKFQRFFDIAVVMR